MDDLLSRQYQIKENSLLLIIDLDKDTDLELIKKKVENFSCVIHFSVENCSSLMGHVYIDLLSKIVHSL